MHLERIDYFLDKINTATVEHCIVYDDPYKEDVNVTILHPSPRFIAELIHGGIHPPISSLMQQKLRLTSQSGLSEIVSRIDADEWRHNKGPIAQEFVVDNTRANDDVEGPMTYEKAIEYCIMKDIPAAVWGRRHNRITFAIVRKADLPDRSTRAAWRMSS